MMKFLKNTAIVFILFIVSAIPTFAGEIGLGLNLGFSRETSGSSDEISSINIALEKYKSANTGTKTVQLNSPFSPALGVNSRYNFKVLLFRIGMYYSEDLLFSPEGSITPAGSSKNKIELNTWEASFPVSVCFNITTGDSFSFYMGFGLSLSLIHLEIKQSVPSAISGLPTVKKEEWDTVSGGAHFITGLEVPLSSRYSLTAEWLLCRGKEEDGSANTKRSLDLTKNLFLFGINYYIGI